MLQFQTILHPTDFSQRSEYALRWACELARDHGARVILLHVWSPPLVPLAAEPAPVASQEFSTAEAEAELARLNVPDPTIDVKRRLEEGDAAAEIVRVARETKCDLIVIGTHGRTGLARLVMGSTAEAVIRRAPCSVLAVKEPPYHTGVAATPAARETGAAP
jgi:nucleotide-binding universal stress UspA family protein